MAKKTKNPLRKRILRSLRQDLGKNLALFLFLTLIISFISGFIVADESMQKAYHEGPEKYHLEDGHFAVEHELSARDIRELEKAGDVTIAPLTYKEKTGKKGQTVRVYTVTDREENNMPCLMDGRLPETKDETATDRLFMENNGLSLGDQMTIGGREYTICGVVAVPDYSCLYKRNSDMMFDAQSFTYALVTEESFEDMTAGGLTWNYVWYWKEDLTEEERNDRSEDLLTAFSDYFEDQNEEKAEAYAEEAEAVLSAHPVEVLSALGTADPSALASLKEDEEALEELLEEPAVKELLKDVREPSFNYLTDYLQIMDNRAYTFTGEDIGKDLVMITTLFYILVVVMGFLFGISIKSTIEGEASAIGTLRASGYTRGELLRHYMVIPAALTILAALFGNLLGYTAMKGYAAGLYYGSYSLPTYETVWSSEAFWLTTAVPLALILLIDLLMIARSLRIPPLQFLRGELRKQKKTKVRRLERGSFLHRFRLRVLGQNKGGYLILFFGILFASLILIFSTAITPLLDHFRDEVTESKFADYQYVLKAETETEDKDAEKYCVNTLIEPQNTEEVTLYGMEEDSRYLDLDWPKERGKGKIGTKENPAPVYLSGGYFKKFGYEEGDVITLSEKYGKKSYTFEVIGEVRYDAALILVTDREDFNLLFGKDRKAFNGYLSDRELTDLDENYIATVVTADDLTAIADQLTDSMGHMMKGVQVFSVVIYLLLMYLITKIILERNAGDIALLKILGYSGREANRLYSDATGIVTILSLIISQPIIYGIFGLLWSRMMRLMNGYLLYYVPFWIFPFLIATGAVCYFLLQPILLRRIRKIPAGIILKGE